MYKEESESELDFEEEQEEESESAEIEKTREIKKAPAKKKSTNNIFDYINEKNAKRYKQ